MSMKKEHICRIYDVIRDAFLYEFMPQDFSEGDEEAALWATWNSISEQVNALIVAGALNRLPETIIGHLLDAGFQIVPLDNAERDSDEDDGLFRTLEDERPAWNFFRNPE